MKRINVEIADTSEKLAQGLMFRKSLDQDDGMLFKFPSKNFMSFWGKNTYIPLDLAFINNEGKIIEIKEIVPMSTKAIRSAFPCRYALEVNAGFFDEQDIKVGSKIEIDEKNGKIKFFNELV